MQSAKGKMQNKDGSAGLTKSQYNKSVMVALFISEVKCFLDKQYDVTDICFSPKLKGYEIDYKRKDISVKIICQFKMLGRFKIKKYENGVLKSSFTLKNSEDSKVIAQKL